jgi:hypothetical protein
MDLPRRPLASAFGATVAYERKLSFRGGWGANAPSATKSRVGSIVQVAWTEASVCLWEYVVTVVVYLLGFLVKRAHATISRTHSYLVADESARFALRTLFPSPFYRPSRSVSHPLISQFPS